MVQTSPSRIECTEKYANTFLYSTNRKPEKDPQDCYKSNWLFLPDSFCMEAACVYMEIGTFIIQQIVTA